MAGPRHAPFPWVFPYIEEPVGATHPPNRLIYRPATEVVLVGPVGATPKTFALIDSGSEHSYAGPWVPTVLGVEPEPATQIEIGVGGARRTVRFAEVEVRLIAPSGDEGEYIDWRTEIGFFTQWEPPWAVLLGQRGFLDRFTITFFRPAFAVEEGAVFDQRFPAT